jgi:hypothetical protein
MIGYGYDFDREVVEHSSDEELKKIAKEQSDIFHQRTWNRVQLLDTLSDFLNQLK